MRVIAYRSERGKGLHSPCRCCRILRCCSLTLILDEATSALDKASKARIREAIEQFHGDLTVLIFGHKLPTLEHADRVVLLGQG